MPRHTQSPLPSFSTSRFAATALLVALIYASTAEAGNASIDLTDATGTSTVGEGTFFLNQSFAISIAGSTIYRDLDFDGLSDGTLNQNYSTDLALGFEYVILTLDPGNVTAFSNFGPLSSTFDWSLTVYDGVVASGDPRNPIGSAFFGHATFEQDRTVLHISESLLWTSGLFIGDWAGYKLAGLGDLAINTNESGAFVLESLPVPAPGAFLLLAGVSFATGRRRVR